MSKKLKYILLCLFIIMFGEEIKRPSMEHSVYFEDTQNQLNVYRLYGREDGNTIFVLGGIQGDEPGGFMSADLYPNIVLEKGNMIVIPRANFHSIITNNRGTNGDMNRKFRNEPLDDTEGKIVEIIKKYMEQSDVFLNLHDGWGFYSDTYVGPGRNPERFGQSIIADAAVYYNGKDTLYLENVARKVLAKTNEKIKNPKHHLHFMNTYTFEKNSNFKEMKTSATYYALKKYGIYAFGIESSKNLSSVEEKILYHNFAINGFMDYFDVIPEHPAVIAKKPVLKYLVITNGERRKICGNGETLHLEEGEVFEINEIIANCERGLSCDVVGWGTNHDINKKIKMISDGTILVRKDSEVIGRIDIKVADYSENLFAYVFKVNGQKKVVLENETLFLKRGDIFEIVDVLLSKGHSQDFEVNLKGFVPPDHGSNAGEDRGFKVNTRYLNWKKYSVHGKGEVFPIIVSLNNSEVSRMYISIKDSYQ